MPIARIPFPPLTPDLGNINNPGLIRACNGLYYGGKWGYVPGMRSIGSLSGDPFDLNGTSGFHVHTIHDSNLASQSYLFYVAGPTEIYGSSSANDLELDNLTSGVGDLNPTAASGVQFTSFGDSVIATDFNTAILRQTTTGGQFSAMVINNSPLTSFTPKARYITTIKNSVLLGHIQLGAETQPSNSPLAINTKYPSMVWWSAIDNPTLYGTPASTPDAAYDGSDYQQLLDEHGAITGLVGGDYAYIFKERAIYRMDGPPYTFRPIVTGSGTLYCNSIVRYYDDIYYWGPGGPTVLRNGSSVPEILGLGKISRTMMDMMSSYIPDPHVFGTVTTRIDLPPAWDSSYNKKRNIGAFVDYRTGLIAWTLSSAFESDYGYDWPGKVLIYSIQDDSFSYANYKSHILYPKTVVGYMDGSLYNSSFSLGYAFKDTFFLGHNPGTEIGVDADLQVRDFAVNVTSVYDADTQHNPTPITFEFSSLAMPPSAAAGDEQKSSRIVGLRLIYESEHHVLGDGIGAQNPGETGEVGELVLDGNGNAIEQEAAAVYHPKIRVRIKTKSRFPSLSHIVAVEVDPTNTLWQEENGWIDIETVDGDYHQIYIELHDHNGYSGDGIDTMLPFIQSIAAIEVDYVSGSERGSAYIG